MKKFFLAAVTLFAFAAASSAVDIAKIDLNFYCRGNLKLLTEKLPEGVKVSARKNYTNKKIKNYDKICYYTIDIDLAKTQEINLEFEVVDTEGAEALPGGSKDSAKLNPSMSPLRKQSFECLEFEVADEPSDKVPLKITQWTHMGSFTVSQGEKFTIKAKFKKPAK